MLPFIRLLPFTPEMRVSGDGHEAGWNTDLNQCAEIPPSIKTETHPP
jgi:hypothetical protein